MTPDVDDYEPTALRQRPDVLMQALEVVYVEANRAGERGDRLSQGLAVHLRRYPAREWVRRRGSQPPTP